MRKFIVILCIAVFLISIASGCMQSTADKAAPAALYNIDVCNCLFMDDTPQRFYIPIISNKKFANLSIVQLNGPGTDTLDWQYIFNDPKEYSYNFYKGYNVYPSVIEISNVKQPVQITSMSVKADDARFDLNLNRFQLDRRESDFQRLFNRFSEWSLPLNIPELYTDEASLSLGFTPEAPFVIDRIFFNDFISVAGDRVKSSGISIPAAKPHK